MFDGAVNAFGNLANCKYFLNVTKTSPLMTHERQLSSWHS